MRRNALDALQHLTGEMRRETSATGKGGARPLPQSARAEACYLGCYDEMGVHVIEANKQKL
jgi:hypothetical protein